MPGVRNDPDEKGNRLNLIPAVETGLTDHVWEIEDLVKLID
jgi:hypothetical protein